MRIDFQRSSASCWYSCYSQQCSILDLTERSYFGFQPIIYCRRKDNTCLDAPVTWNARLMEHGLNYWDAALLVVLEHVEGDIELLAPRKG